MTEENFDQTDSKKNTLDMIFNKLTRIDNRLEKIEKILSEDKKSKEYDIDIDDIDDDLYSLNYVKNGIKNIFSTDYWFNKDINKPLISLKDLDNDNDYTDDRFDIFG